MDNIERLFEKLEKMSDHQSEMNVTLARLTVSVEEHVKRSDLFETALAEVKIEIDPLKKHVHFMKTTGENIWLVGKLLTLSGAIIGGVTKAMMSIRGYLG